MEGIIRQKSVCMKTMQQRFAISLRHEKSAAVTTRSSRGFPVQIA
jgi:hypothetical protein